MKKTCQIPGCFNEIENDALLCVDCQAKEAQRAKKDKPEEQVSEPITCSCCDRVYVSKQGDVCSTCRGDDDPNVVSQILQEREQENNTPPSQPLADWETECREYPVYKPNSPPILSEN